jgi:ribonuclease P protein subunit POP4
LTPITARNLTRHELIGLRVKIIGSSCKSNIGLLGKIINETKNMLVISNGLRQHWLPKEESNFQFKLQDDSTVEVEGKRLVGRPEDRVKKAVRRRW